MSARRKAAGLLVGAGLLAGWTTPSPSPAARAHTGAPRVQSMIVGRHGVVLSRARSILAGPATVRVGGRSCAVAPSQARLTARSSPTMFGHGSGRRWK